MRMMKKNISWIFDNKYVGGIVSALQAYKRIVLLIIALAVFVDSFYLPTSSDLITFSLLLVYGIFVKVTHAESRQTFLFCLVLLFVMFVSYLFSAASIPTEKVAVWLFLFIAFGVVQQTMQK